MTSWGAAAEVAIRALGFMSLAAWVILEYVQARRFGHLEIESPRDVARRRWFGRHPVILALLLQVFIVGLVLGPVLVFLILGDQVPALWATARLVLGCGLLVFVIFGITRLARKWRMGYPRESLKLQAVSLAAWFVGLFSILLA